MVSAPIKKAKATVQLEKRGNDWFAKFPNKEVVASKYQSNVFDWFMNGAGNAVINAVAGSGKSTTLEMLCALLPNGSNALFCAFNKHIQQELERRLPRTVVVKTIHSLGYGSLAKAWGKLNLDGNKYSQLCLEAWSELVNACYLDKPADFTQKLLELIRGSVGFTQSALIEPSDLDSFEAVICHNGLDQHLDETDIELEVLSSIVKSILNRGIELAQSERVIDYIDMIWLPCVLNLHLDTFDYIFVDECQDLNACQLELVLRAQHNDTRYLFVGDKSQAIYGFAGADSNSYENIIRRTNATVLPLNVCYRCPKSHILLAKEYVPEIEWADSAPEGTVTNIHEYHLASTLKAQDLVLCRKTAPLVKLCINLLAKGLPASVKGRDIAKTLVNVIKQISEISGFTYKDFGEYVEIYRERQIKKFDRKKNNESLIERLNDQLDAIYAVYENCQMTQLAGLIKYLESLFSDKEQIITLSTVHRAKGLESNRVFIIHPEFLPLFWKNQLDWQAEQERNLTYVAYTRAKEALFFVEMNK